MLINLFISFIGLLCISVSIAIPYYNLVDKESDKINFKILTLVGFILVLFSFSFSIIPTGYTGVQTTFGQINNVTLQNGFNWKIPIVQSIELVNNKQQDITFDDKVWSETSERTAIYYAGSTITYQINPEKSAWIYANVSNYKNDLVTQSLIASAIKTSSKTLNDVDSTNRGKIEPLIAENLQHSLDEKYGKNTIIINKVIISDADFDKAYNDAIAAKQEAQLVAEKKEIENKQAIAKAEADAKVKITEAEAEANSKLIIAQGEADANKKLNESLSENILRGRYIDKWDGSLPKIVSGENGSFLIDINDISETKPESD